MATVEERFWAKVDTTGECWVWTAACCSSGYGHLTVAGRTVLAHRLAWEWANGPIPEGMKVCHSCDNPRCVRTSHHFLGSDADNQRDASLKGRQRGQGQDRCVKGHLFTEANTYHRPGTVAARDCRTCIRERSRRHQRGRTF